MNGDTHYHYHYHYASPAQGEAETEYAPATVVCPECRAETQPQELGQSRLFLNKSECPVCMANPIETILYCGHGLCNECCKRLEEKYVQLQEEMEEDEDDAELIATLVMGQVEDLAILGDLGYSEDRLSSMVLQNCDSIANVDSFNALVNGLGSNDSVPGYWTKFPWTAESEMVVRRKFVSGEDDAPTEVFLLHPDMCGQYGEWSPDTDHRPFVTIFTNGLVQIMMPS